jgi:hypothetical protein
MITLEEKAELKMHFSLLRCKAELDQLKNGLSILGLLQALHSYPDIFAPYFYL